VLQGRTEENAMLGRLVAEARAGRGQVLVLHGEAGVGKTALLEQLVELAEGCRVVRAAGVESEMELVFAGLHQLCAPLLDRLDRLPGPQATALATAFGLDVGDPPDRFLVGLAVLTLLADTSDDAPLVCVVDDGQWLDRVSAQTIAFVARRLFFDPVALVIAVRDGTSHEFDKLPGLELRGLRESDARALLDSVLRLPVDERVRDRIVAETRGNPLALLELTRGLTPTQVAGGFGIVGTTSLSGQIEAGYVARLASLAPDTRRLVLAAAAEPVGDAVLLWRAAEQLGIASDAGAAAAEAGLLELDSQVRFRHPLVRSAVYRSASPDERAEAHRTLAAATDPAVDPDRRAWHLAAAATEPDDDIASELEQSAGRAQARGGLAAAAAFLQRSVELTNQTGEQPRRALTAAQVCLHAGDFDAAFRMLAAAEASPLDDLQSARAELLHGQIGFASGVGGDAPQMLLRAAKRLEALDPELARETYLDAWGAALFAGSFASAGSLLEVSRAALSAPRRDPPRAADLLLDGLATLVAEGRTAAVPRLREATNAFASDEVTREENFRWGWLATVPAAELWDEESWHAINVQALRRARVAGALVRLPLDLTALAVLVTWRGDLATAAAAIEEAETVMEVTGTHIPPYSAMLLACFRGRERDARALVESTLEFANVSRQGFGVQYANWVAAVLWNGLGRYDAALSAARDAVPDDLFLSGWALPELVEAAAKAGEPQTAREAYDRLQAMTAAAAESNWAAGIEARSRALVSEGDAAESAYRQAIELLGRTRLRPEAARSHLLYGEWLRVASRRVDAREQLHAAHELFVADGMEAFAERTRTQLVSTGVKLRRVVAGERDQLTAQEAQIARLARDGLSNPEIAARLFLSPRTVEWHLRKIFTKLAVSSRRELRDVLGDPAAPLPA
jgi:DNA-binding CsgD family transcriptional regulator/tetratricopeptide (TPR) repeat protein